MVATLCNWSTDAAFIFVDGTRPSPGPTPNRKEAWPAATWRRCTQPSTSGIGPTGPANTSTGRSFIPAVSPNGKLARQISPGLIYGLAVRQSVNILPHVAQLVTPGSRNIPWPKGAHLIFIVPEDNQVDATQREVPRRFRADLMVVIELPHSAAWPINLLVESDRSPPVQPAYLSGGEQARRHRVAYHRGHGLLRFQDRVTPQGRDAVPKQHCRRCLGERCKPGLFHSCTTYSASPMIRSWRRTADWFLASPMSSVFSLLRPDPSSF